MNAPLPARSGSTVLLVLCLSVSLVLVGMVVPAAAQPSDPTHWGARVSFVKNWTMAKQVKDLLSDDGSELDIQGSEFEIGFVRGSRLGGDWGVSFVKKPWKDGSGDTTIDQDCFNQAQTICKPRTEVNATQNAVLTGFEVHWFIRIVNIKQRVQVGVNVAGGLGLMSGQVVKTTDRFEPTGFNQQGPTGYTAVHEVEINEAKDELLPFFPQIKIEAVASVILAPKFKIQIAHGLNFPAITPRIAGVVLF